MPRRTPQPPNMSSRRYLRVEPLETRNLLAASILDGADFDCAADAAEKHENDLSSVLVGSFLARLIEQNPSLSAEGEMDPATSNHATPEGEALPESRASESARGGIEAPDSSSSRPIRQTIAAREGGIEFGVGRIVTDSQTRQSNSTQSDESTGLILPSSSASNESGSGVVLLDPRTISANSREAFGFLRSPALSSDLNYLQLGYGTVSDATAGIASSGLDHRSPLLDALNDFRAQAVSKQQLDLYLEHLDAQPSWNSASVSQQELAEDRRVTRASFTDHTSGLATNEPEASHDSVEEFSSRVDFFFADGMLAIDVPTDLLPLPDHFDGAANGEGWDSPIGTGGPSNLDLANGALAQATKSESRRIARQERNQQEGAWIDSNLRPAIAATSVAFGSIFIGLRRHKAQHDQLQQQFQQLR